MNKLQGSKGCFTLDSQVLTPKGYVKITDLRCGDTVTSFDSDGKFCESVIKDIHTYHDERVGRYRAWGGACVGVTPSHWAINQYGAFAAIGSFEIGQDGLVNENGHLIHIDSVMHSVEDVIGIKLESIFTLIVNGIRFHNGALGTTELDDYLSGRKGGKSSGGSSRPPVEEPNTLRSKSVARIIDVVSNGEIVGLGNDPLKNVFFDETPVQNDDGTFNFEGVEIVERVGSFDQDYIPGFPTSENEVSVGVEVKKTTPVSRTISNSSLDALRVKVQIPSLVKADINTGDRRQTDVRIQIDIAPDSGSFTTIVDDTIDGKTTSAYERSYRIPLPAGGAPWTVRMVRVTADSTTDTLQNKTFFSSYTEIIDAKIQYADTALYGVSVDSELFGGTIPSRSYLIKGMKIQVPTNYDPETRVYTGIWDGTFKNEWTDNPAWVFYDLLVNNLYGLGDKISNEFVDIGALYSISQYCDELVDDGKGGQEPRFAMNAIINSQQEAYAVLNTVASAFRAMPYWGNGAITLAQDAPQNIDDAMIVGPANVVGGVFNYSGSARKSRHSRIVVSYLDPDDGYRTNIEVVENNELIDIYGVREIQVSAFGCTSAGQANRLGRWILDTEEFETETVTYTAGYDHAGVYPGDIIKVSDPSYMGSRNAGRLKQLNLSKVMVDAPVSLVTTDSYSISIVLADGSIHTSALSVLADGDYTDLDLVTPMPSNATDGAMWSLSSGSLSPRLFRVLSNSHIDNGYEFEISALLYDENKFSRVENGITINPKNFSNLPSGPISKPVSISVSEYLFKSISGSISAATISWEAPSDTRVVTYEVQISTPQSGGFKTIYSGSDLSTDISNTQTGLYNIRIKSISATGQSSPYFTKSFDFEGLSTPPDDVDNFFVSRMANGSRRFSWNFVDDFDIEGYRIRFGSADETDWNKLSNISSNLITQNPYETNQIGAGTYAFAIKAVDVIGNESVNATFIVVTLGDQPLENSLRVIEYPINRTQSGNIQYYDWSYLTTWSDWSSWGLDNRWLGELTNCVEFEGAIYAQKYDWNNLSTWTGWESWDHGDNVVWEFVTVPINIGFNVNFTPLVTADVIATYQMSVSMDGINYGPFTDISETFGQYVKIKVISSASIMRNLSIIIDGKTIQEFIDDLDTSLHHVGVNNGDFRAPIQQEYNTINYVGVTLQNVGAGWSFDVVDKDADLGPRIRIYNELGVLSDAITDVFIRGV